MENQIIVKETEINNFLNALERCALNPTVDVDKMQKLLDMQERILDKKNYQDYCQSFAEMQAELPQIAERTKAHNTKYATFEAINKEVQPIMHKHGFSISFQLKQESNSITTTAILMHKAGHSERTEITLPSDTSGSKNSVQAVGSSTSYGKRYTMCAILNIVTCGEDDDGNFDKKNDLATDSQRKVIDSLYNKLNSTQQENFNTATGGLLKIKKKDVDAVIAKINKSIGESK